PARPRAVTCPARPPPPPLAQPDDPGMLAPALYAADVVPLSCAPPLGPVRPKQDILRLSQCSLAPRQGYRRVSIVEFLPLTSAIAPAPAKAHAPAPHAGPLPPPLVAKPSPAHGPAA